MFDMRVDSPARVHGPARDGSAATSVTAQPLMAQSLMARSSGRPPLKSPPPEAPWPGPPPLRARPFEARPLGPQRSKASSSTGRPSGPPGAAVKEASSPDEPGLDASAGTGGLSEVVGNAVEVALAELAGSDPAGTLALVSEIARATARLQGLMIHAQVHLARLRPPPSGDEDDAATGPYSEFAAEVSSCS